MITELGWADKKRINAVLAHNPIEEFAKHLVELGVTRDQLRIVLIEHDLLGSPSGNKLVNYHRTHSSE